MELGSCVRKTELLLLCLFILLSVQYTTCETCKKQEDSMCEIVTCSNVPVTCTNVTTEMLNQLQYCNSRSSYVLKIIKSKIPVVDKNSFPVDCDFRSRIVKLTLANNSIQTIDANSFANFSELHTLDVGYNEISNIDFLNQLNQLRILNVSFNKLEVIKKETFQEFRNLEELYLNNNFLKDVEDTAFQSLQRLIILDLSSNHIEDLPSKAFIGLSSLKAIYLLNNKIQTINQYSFYGLNSIEQLTICGNQHKSNTFQYVDNSFNNIVIDNNSLEIQNDTFQGLSSLKTLHLINLRITKINCGTLHGLESLTSLYLNNTTVEKIESSAFNDLNAISLIKSDSGSNPQLDMDKGWYDLSNLSIQSLGPYVLGKLSYYPDQHNFLYLNNNNLTIVLQNTFRNVSHLNAIKLDNNDIEEIQPYAFDTLSFNKKLTSYKDNGINYNTLDLNNNKLTILHKNTFGKMESVMKLRLDNNKINEIHPETFSGVSFQSQISNNNILYLNENKITRLLKATFKNTQNLVVLRLDHNAIGTIELETFTDLHELKTLDLSNNQISMLHSELFAGLINLQNLLLTNNQIKELPLGSLKHFPRLQNLQLGNNYLFRFKTGSFSNLRELNYLNLSHNKFSALNETVLYPLKTLKLLDLDDNNFSYINYTSLLTHLPRLEFISVNNNRWGCQMLTHMLKTFRSRRVDYLFNATSHYSEENVDGIFCSEDQAQNDDKTISSIERSKLFKETTDSDTLNFIKEFMKPNTKSEMTKVHDSDKYVTFEQLHELITNINSKGDVIPILILLSCSIMCTLLGFSVYKKHCQKINGKIPLTKPRSEIELLNAES